jgi:heme-degrading monooxygenase HmoA
LGAPTLTTPILPVNDRSVYAPRVAARFVLEFQVTSGREEDVRHAYAALRERLERGVPGLLGHQLCQNADDPLRFIITSEWEDLEASTSWDRSAEHNELVAPLRACFERAGSTKYVVQDGLPRP